MTSDLIEVCRALARRHGDRTIGKGQFRTAIIWEAPALYEEYAETPAATAATGEALVEEGLAVFEPTVVNGAAGDDGRGVEVDVGWNVTEVTLADVASDDYSGDIEDPIACHMIRVSEAAVDRHDVVREAMTAHERVRESQPELHWETSPFRLLASPTMLRALDAVIDRKRFSQDIETFPDPERFTKTDFAAMAGVTTEALRKNAVFPRLRQLGLIERVDGGQYHRRRSEPPTAGVFDTLYQYLHEVLNGIGNDQIREMDVPQRHESERCPDCGTVGDRGNRTVYGHGYDCPDCGSEWVNFHYL